MNEKITLQDLVELLSIKLGITKKHADTVVREFFNLIEEALATEKYVKIKGLGTFKLTEVDSRESMNVNTGERIEIQGHTKISFTPDTIMKDLINKPFSHFETVVLNDGVQLEDTPFEEEAKTDEITDEKVEIIVEQPEMQVVAVEEEVPANMEETSVQQVVEEEESVAEEEPSEEDVETQVPIVEEAEEANIVEETSNEELEIQEPVVEEIEEANIVEETSNEESETQVSVVEEEVEEPKEETVPVEEHPIENAEKQEEPIEESIAAEEKQEEHWQEKIQPEIIREPQHPNNQTTFRILIGIIIVLVLIILFGLYWMFMRSDNAGNSNQVSQPVQEPSVNVIQEEPTIKEDSVQNNVQMNPDTLVAVQSESQEQFAVLSENVEYAIAGTITTLTLEPGQTLVKLALKYYGSKNFWPYIMQHNPDVIKDADIVPIGATIKIPKLEPKK